MAKQVIVIGLGHFGMSVAQALSEKGAEVLAVDREEDKVRAAAAFAAEAAQFDAGDQEALRRASPERRDVCICAIGDEAREDSIVCTALLRQMGAPRVIARANDDLHARILRLVGAHEVVNPEREFGLRFANRIVHDQVRGEMTLGPDLLISEVQASDALTGKTLAELSLPRRFGVTVVAIRGQGDRSVTLPSADSQVRPGDTLVVISKEKDLNKLMEQS